MATQKMKRLPSGVSDFEVIRRDNLYYIDKTEYIERLEENDHFVFFVRPRRFGKSLFLSMLRYYYDINEAHRFDELFSGLYIHEHPTENRGQYMILYMDFSLVKSEVDNLEESFSSYCSDQIDSFLRRYKSFFSDKNIEDITSKKNLSDKFNTFNTITNDLNIRKYLILDEYDNFTNTILSLSGGEDVYKRITHGVGFYRDLFKQFKPNFERITMMGVSPVTMDDLTSGFNIASNITFEEWFNSALGFSETEVREMIEYYRSAGAIISTADELMAEMKPWYDNNCFSPDCVDSERVYNSNMTLHYLKNQIKYNRPPREMVDSKSATDYAKLRRLVNIDASSPYRKGVLRRIAEDGYIVAKLRESFPAEYIRKQEYYISLLYFYGMLTISGVDGEDLKLSIPNRCIKARYWEFMREYYDNKEGIIDLDEINQCFRTMAMDGQFSPFISYMSKCYHDSTSVRSSIQGERGVQAYLLAHLNLTTYFVVKTEKEMNHGFADFVLYPNLSRFDYLRHAFIVELKYISKTDDTPELRAAKLAEAHKQLDIYADDKELAALPQDSFIHKIIVLCAGDEMLVEIID